MVYLKYNNITLGSYLNLISFRKTILNKGINY